MNRRVALLAALLVLAAAPAIATPAHPSLGDVDLANSCAAGVQPALQTAFALLHDFEYTDATDGFVAVEKADPACAIAYWGEAMAHNHPVWMDQNLPAARAALARYTPALARSRPPTPREAAYLHAAGTLFGDGSKDDRDNRYAIEMGKLHRAYPEDVDAAAFYALALLGTCHDGRDIPTYLKAAAVLEQELPAHPGHPGVLHYMIHSYDDPAHAELGMRAARLYGRIAAGAPHAVHMTSHIFIALGMWDEVITANAEAIRAVNARLPGQQQAACGHYAEWLIYGLLQERRFGQADIAIERCGTQASQALARHPQPVFPGHSPVQSYADMQAREAIEMAVWNPGSVGHPDPGAYVDATFETDYAAAITARDPAARQDAAARMRADFARMQTRPAGEDPGGDRQQMQYAQVMTEEVAALEQPPDAAIATLRQAAAQETTIPVEFGPPAVPKPALELLGDVLLRNGHPADAASAYRAALIRAPGRTLSLRGLLVAQDALGQARAAAATQVTLARYVRTTASPP